ncbi:hypothetical protein [Streptomyces cyaneofuscatus]|uniref:hypothetical protein n=1 Tax=Streptomyces cyaneofuscatus TaxID=66883 RepID=UPI0036DC8438
MAAVRRIRILLAAGLNTDLIREVLPCMAEEGAILAPTCEEMAQDVRARTGAHGRSIERLQSAHAMLSSIIHAGEALTAEADRGDRPHHRAVSEQATSSEPFGRSPRLRAESVSLTGR